MNIDPRSIGIPMSARPLGDPRKLDGVKGSEFLHGALDGAKSLYDISMQEAGGKALLKAAAPTIGTQAFNDAMSAVDFVKGFDPSNLAGSVPFALDMMKQLQIRMPSGAQFISGMLGDKLSGLLSLMPMLNQLGNLDLMQQAQNLISQELANLPLPQLPQLPDVGAITSQLQMITEIPSGIGNIIPQLPSIPQVPDVDAITAELQRIPPTIGNILP